MAFATSRNHAHLAPLIASCRRVGVAGPAVAMLMAGWYGFGRGHDVVTSVGFAAGYAMASYIVGFGLVFLFHAFRIGRRDLAALMGAVYLVALAAEYQAHLGVMTLEQTKGLTAASTSRAAFAAKNHGLSAAQAEVDRLQALVAAPLGRSGADARAAIEKAKLSPRWTASAGCTDVTAPPSRRLCTEYHAAVADLDAATKREADLALLAKAREAMASASTGVVQATVVTSGEAAQGEALAKILNWSFDKPPSAVDVERSMVLSAMLLSALFVGFGILNAVSWELFGADADASVANGAGSVANGSASSAASPASTHVASARVTPLQPRGDAHAVKTLADLIGRRQLAA